MNKPNIVGGGVLFAIAASYGYMILKLPSRNLPNTVGADFMPIIFDVGLALLSIILVFQGLRGDRGRTGSRAPVPLTLNDVIGIVVVFAMFFAYVFLIDIVGFLIITPIVLLVLLLLQGVRRPLAVIAVCLGVTVGVYVLFRYGFDVQIAGFPSL